MINKKNHQSGGLNKKKEMFQRQKIANFTDLLNSL